MEKKSSFENFMLWYLCYRISNYGDNGPLGYGCSCHGGHWSDPHTFIHFHLGVLCSLGGLQELPVNVENMWTNHNGEKTITVKYTDKRMFEELINEYKELYPEIEQLSSAKSLTVKVCCSIS